MLAQSTPQYTGLLITEDVRGVIGITESIPKMLRFDAARALEEGIGEEHLTAQDYLALGTLAGETGHFSSAEEYFASAYNMANIRGRPIDEVIVKLTVAEFYYGANGVLISATKGDTAFDEAAVIARKSDDSFKEIILAEILERAVVSSLTVANRKRALNQLTKFEELTAGTMDEDQRRIRLAQLKDKFDKATKRAVALELPDWNAKEQEAGQEESRGTAKPRPSEQERRFNRFFDVKPKRPNTGDRISITFAVPTSDKKDFKWSVFFDELELNEGADSYHITDGTLMLEYAKAGEYIVFFKNKDTAYATTIEVTERTSSSGYARSVSEVKWSHGE
jgi:hypothetical protein